MSIKDKFLKYLGEPGSLSKYTRSYKLVFLLIYFELDFNTGKVNSDQLTKYFKLYYEDRKRNGLIPDHNVDARITNIEKANPEQIFGLILKNPYNYLNKHGYMNIEIIEGERFFSIPISLNQELTDSDRRYIKELMHHKLDKYYVERVN